jgi:hypothetical protein
MKAPSLRARPPLPLPIPLEAQSRKVRPPSPRPRVRTTSLKRRGQRRAPLPQPLAEEAEVEQAAGRVAAVNAAPAAEAVGAIAFAAVAGRRALAAVETENAVAAGAPMRCRRPALASWNRARCPRSSRSHRPSRPLARSSCGIAAWQLRLPRSSSATTNGPAPKGRSIWTRLAFDASRVPHAECSSVRDRRESAYRVNDVIPTNLQKESRVFCAFTRKTTRSLVPRDDTGAYGRSRDYSQRGSINRIERRDKRPV